MKNAALLRARFVAVLFAVAATLFSTVVFGGTEAELQYRLGSGDKIYVTVFGHKDLSGEFDIDGGGNVSFPLVGNILLGGLAIGDAEAAIRDTLRPDYLLDPRVSVQVMNYRPFYILGEVKEPGSYPYVNGMTVMQAVALAGGYTYRAREDNMLIIRTGPEGKKEGPAREETTVFPGDIIKIPERFF
ncbi:MAG: polysaccharide biosynthesis protein [Rhodospirillaceae bacterium]|nr:MAG: polysaccharide biosynthesis protein [Rhodospirillaceae bacterium]